MKTIEFVNSFHNTRAKVRVRKDSTVSFRAWHAALKRCCPYDECYCPTCISTKGIDYYPDWKNDTYIITQNL